MPSCPTRRGAPGLDARATTFGGGPGSVLSTLDRPERSAVALHDFAGLSSGQIAGITDRPIDQVHTDLRAGTAKAEAQQAAP
ncbi:hypothetical protein [Arthrobacter sp. CAN_A1]|uniref:hypothetical protein n=1 Tax=Arthrobacter sp. CAN_A1 TaxID=2787717 RepID=UPI0018CAE9CC